MPSALQSGKTSNGRAPRLRPTAPKLLSARQVNKLTPCNLKSQAGEWQPPQETPEAPPQERLRRLGDTRAPGHLKLVGIPNIEVRDIDKAVGTEVSTTPRRQLLKPVAIPDVEVRDVYETVQVRIAGQIGAADERLMPPATTNHRSRSARFTCPSPVRSKSPV